MLELDGLIQDMMLLRATYSNVIGVESIRDPVIHLRADSLFSAQTGQETKIVNVMYDARRHSIIEICPQGPSSQFPHQILISTCVFPRPMVMSMTQHQEGLELMREQARSLAPEVTCVSLDDCTSFLYDFPSVYSKISKSLLQTNLTIDPRKLVGLTLGLMNQVIHFEDTKQ